MPKKVTVSIEVSYVFKGELLAEYLEQLGDHRDTKTQRAWFAVDRMVGDEGFTRLRLEKVIDPRSTLSTTEVEVA